MSRKRRSAEERKPAEERKTTGVRVRLTAAHCEEIKRAARRVGLTVSAWITERLLRAARSECGEARRGS